MRYLIAAIFLFLHVVVYGQQLYSTGLVFNDENYSKANIRANLNSEQFNDLPLAVSLKQYCPRPGNQLQLNTSPSWATTWSAQSILEAIKNDWTDQDYITQNTYSPAFNYYHVRESDDENCDSGIDLYTALNFLKYKGAKHFDDFLEFCPRGIPEDIVDPSNLDSISDFVKLFDSQHSDQFKLQAVKKSLSENYPVVIGMYCPPSFFSAKTFWQPSEIASAELPGHALCIVGYDDQKFGGAFEVLNSWGSLWGNQGFLWIRYEDFVSFTKYAYEIFNVEKSKYDTFDFSGSISLKLNSNLEIEMEKLNDGIFQTSDPLSTGTYFRVYLKNDNPSFVYVFGIDEKNKLFRVFPHQENISPALIYKTNIVAIPGEDNYIEIVGDPGEENLCILYSKEPLDFNQLLFNLEKYPGVVSDNLDALLEGKVISPDNISWKTQGIGFSTSSADKTAVLIQIKINHI